MWTSIEEALPTLSASLFRLSFNNNSATFNQVLTAWQQDDSFRNFFQSLLASIPYKAIRWETPPITLATLHQPFECVILESLELLKPADPSSFSEHFQNTPLDQVVTFENLGLDALLIVPTPSTTKATFPHLKAFAEHAMPAQYHQFWQTVSRSMMSRLSTKPIWLNTAGAGVPWLHLRLDSRPKYYRYRPYTLSR